MASVTSIIGPPLMTNLFAYFTGAEAWVYFPGAAFLTAAVFTVVALLLVVPVYKKWGS
jgi:DHA1 family tetracycline resistance protein-like MFS transporter